jgi:UDP-N-acetylglucosamine:LPS N-acetylglucosamine transferase
MKTQPEQKTVFIVITRGFIIRNILRSGTLRHLLDAGLRVVIFLPLREHSDIPDYLRKEFAIPGVVLEGVVEKRIRGYSTFARSASMLLYTNSTRAYSRIGNQANLRRSWFSRSLENGVYSLLSLSGGLKRLVRYIENNYFFVPEYEHFFEKYHPDVVFGTSMVSTLDIMFMKAARRRGVPTVGMPKGWDNVVKMLYRFIPDVLLVQNERMKEGVIATQGVPEARIVVTGFPQFDWYTRKEILLSREDFLQSLNIDPTRRLVVFGSEGVWAPAEKTVADIIATFVRTPGMLAKPSTLLIRPHYSDVKADKFNALKGLEYVALDTSMNVSDFFMDNWDPTLKEIVYFTNLMHHADVVISIASTLALDAACADTPSISPFFGGLYDMSGRVDITDALFLTDHYQWVLETGATMPVHSVEELQSAINTCLTDPSHLSHERKVLVDRLCFGNDGHASERVAKAIVAQVR